MTDATNVVTTWTITNARVFDGNALSDPRTVFVEDGRIVDVGSSDNVVDAGGRTLLPGFIDSHIHLDSIGNLREFAQWGVTTALDMGTQSSALIDSLRGVSGLTDIRSAGSSASGPGSMQTVVGGFDPSTSLAGPDDAARFIADRRAEGSDYVKIIIENPAEKGPVALSGATIAALVTAAHAAGLQTIAHASSTTAVQMGIDAGVDILTHVPLNAPLAPEMVEMIASKGIAVIPTLSMMAGIATKVGLPTIGNGPGYHNAREAVRALHSAGAVIVAGTDANNAPFVPFSPAQGESLHGELELLVAAGLSPVEALRSSTVQAAELFGLSDRGAVEPGLRADLVLVEGDPTTDIRATRGLTHVWIGGVRFR